MDTLHTLASTLPIQRVLRSYTWGQPGMTPKFLADTEHHEMQICLDHGLYRHLKFACQPAPFAYPTTSNHSFALLTCPGSLAITGDMGTYTFSRLEDMFRFFDSPAGRINPEYWSEKVTSQDVHSPVRLYSEAKFRQEVLQDFEDRKYEFDPADQIQLLAKINRDILQDPDIYHEHGAREALHAFNFYVQRPGEPRITFGYDNTSELDFKDFSPHFLWCLEAIVFGIDRYRKATGNV